MAGFLGTDFGMKVLSFPCSVALFRVSMAFLAWETMPSVTFTSTPRSAVDWSDATYSLPDFTAWSIGLFVPLGVDGCVASVAG